MFSEITTSFDGEFTSSPELVLLDLTGNGILGIDVFRPLRVKISTHEHTAKSNGDGNQTPKVFYISNNIDIPLNCWCQILLPPDIPQTISVFSPTSKLPPDLRAAPKVSSA
ncbi:hypothetical protein E2C01_015230 [Portunus trituberculatus]|uniref:Uncharacterized protein n=1 Tax=Portunus trituberculatus TaxID=210409 RepID=A0A5B7DL92_PORTR|nr:hypothetical protein [Portunus trituberculatus]